MQPSQFVHLQVHTEYSLVDGLLRVDDYVDALVEQGMVAAAVTDLYNVFAIVKFYQRCLQRGIKPVIGAEIDLADEPDSPHNHRLTLLCQNREGFRNLTQLITLSYMQGQARGSPLVQRDWLAPRAADLIALSDATKGDLGQALAHDDQALVDARLAWYREVFADRFYLALQRTNPSEDDLANTRALTLAERHGIPLVATNDVRFLRQDDFEAHEARVCIQQGYTLDDPKRPRLYRKEQYLKSAAQMIELFHDLPTAVENSVNIARRCNLELQFGDYHLPEFPVPQGFDQASWLRQEAHAGLERMLAPDAAADAQQYQARLDHELNIIVDMGFPGYFLIVADFIRWAKEQGIPVGPGRGSGGGSLVAYVLGITDLDPIAHELIFERFLNAERVSLPDFDVDFCMDRRDEVIEYVSQRYGCEQVAQIITFGSMAAKAVVRDVGRAQNKPYHFVDKIAKLIPHELDMTLDRALELEELLKQRYEEEEDVKELIDLARKLEGLARNAGKHAGGVVISPRPLTDFMPLYCEHNSSIASTQFDMGDVEAIGLVKFDFLGLRTLTIIDNAVKDVNALTSGEAGEALDIKAIPLNDSDTYKTICQMDTTAVFQLESDGMKKLLKRLAPDKFDDLVALVALFRPGPLESGMVEDFIDRKHGRAAIRYPHPALEPALKPTYGVILYQEQVMEIARLLGGYTLGAADLLRRAMGKKKREEMARQRNDFVNGAINNKVERRVATGIFDLMEKFAGYGFNKSHSVAYALLAYQTAWLKTHYPAAFMAAVFSADMNNTDRVVTLRQELMRMQLTLKPPCVNLSMCKFTVQDARTIVFGLGAIKGVGAYAIDGLCLERQQHGEFTDLFDLCRRVDTRRINKRVIEALICAGAMDGLGATRATLVASIDTALRFSEQYNDQAESGQNDLFGLEALTAATSGHDAALPYAQAPEWDEQQRLTGEKDTLGFYLHGHPVNRYAHELSTLAPNRLDRVQPGMNLRVAGYIEKLRLRTGPRNQFAELILDNNTGRMHVTVRNDLYKRHEKLLVEGQLVIIKGEAVADDYYATGLAVNARDIYSLPQLRERFGLLQLDMDRELLSNGALVGLQQILQRHAEGTSRVLVAYNNDQATTSLSLGDSWTVKLSDELLAELEPLLGKDRVKLAFPERVSF